MIVYTTLSLKSHTEPFRLQLEHLPLFQKSHYFFNNSIITKKPLRVGEEWLFGKYKNTTSYHVVSLGNQER